MGIAHILIWVSLGFLIYVHLGYPLVLMVWRKVARRPVCKSAYEPTVTILIAVHNEQDTIERKILNCLQLDYPREKLNMVIALDSPTDNTEDIARKYHSETVQVIALPTRRGKAGALNRAASAARGDILVLADARQEFDRGALRELVANFSDPEIGSVSGELILRDEEGREATNGMGIYWRYEKWIRAQEADIHSMLGATGAIYAIRRKLFRPIPQDTILDDVVIPMRIVLRGKRAIFDGAARAYDRVSANPEIEYGRKVRTLMGNYQLLSQMPELLSPFHNPVWFQFVSHKVARLLVPYFLALLFVANLFAMDGPYVWLLMAQCGWHMTAFAGGVLSRRRMQPCAPTRVSTVVPVAISQAVAEGGNRS